MVEMQTATVSQKYVKFSYFSTFYLEFRLYNIFCNNKQAKIRQLTMMSGTCTYKLSTFQALSFFAFMNYDKQHRQFAISKIIIGMQTSLASARKCQKKCFF